MTPDATPAPQSATSYPWGRLHQRAGGGSAAASPRSDWPSTGARLPAGRWRAARRRAGVARRRAAGVGRVALKWGGGNLRQPGAPHGGRAREVGRKQEQAIAGLLAQPTVAAAAAAAGVSERSLRGWLADPAFRPRRVPGRPAAGRRADRHRAPAGEHRGGRGAAGALGCDRLAAARPGGRGRAGADVPRRGAADPAERVALLEAAREQETGR